MKQVVRAAGLATIMAVAFAGTVFGQTDTTPPELIAFDFTATSVDVTGGPATVTLTFTATDDLSGFGRISVSFLSPSGETAQGSYADFGPAPNVSGSITVTFPQFIEPGVYTARLDLSDKVWNGQSYGAERLAGMGYPTTLTVVSNQDTTPPDLTAFNFADTFVDVTASPATVTVTFSATDDLSGFGRISLSFLSPSGQTAQGSYADFGPAPNVSGSITVTFPQFCEPGVYTARLDINDKIWNGQAYSTQRLAGMGYPTTLTVVSNQDTTPPDLTSFQFKPMAIDLSAGPATVTATFSATDDLSGFGRISLSFLSPSGQTAQGSYADFGPAPNVSGSIIVNFPQFIELGVYTARLDINDKIWNGQAYSAERLRGLGFPTELLVSIQQAVDIDIKPRKFPNDIALKDKGTIEVAVLSGASFDAPASVNTASFTFGRTGDEASLLSCRRKAEDVNRDGRPDLVCEFDVAACGFQPGDTEGVLKGSAISGQPILGRDSVLLVLKNKNK